MLRWNGTFFLGPFISQLTLFTDTAGGQEMPGASDLLLLRSNASTSARKLMAMTINFEMQVKPRFTFAEVGRRRAITRITRSHLLVEKSERLSCLAAPIALVLDETSGDVPSAQSRVLVLSYHMSAITIMDRCPRTGVLALTPNVTQCVAALGQPTSLRSQRGAVGMVLTLAPHGCYGNALLTRCLYVLDIGARSTLALGSEDHVLGAVHVYGLSGVSGALAYVSSLVSGAAVSGLPLGSTVSRYVSGLGGGRSLVVSGDGSCLLLASWHLQGITLLDRDTNTGTLTFADTMTDGERMSWDWSGALPPPSPAALPRTQARDQGNMSLPEAEALDFEASDGREASMLKEPSRVSGPGAPWAYWTAGMQQGNKSYLIVAAGPRGPIMYPWNATSQRFNKGTAWTRRVQNAVHVSVFTLPVQAADGRTHASVFAVVANWVTSDAIQWEPAIEDGLFDDARIEVWQWSSESEAFIFSHPLPCNPPAPLGGATTTSARASEGKFSRSTASFVLSSPAGTQHCLAAAIQQDTGNLVSPSFIYRWEASTARFHVLQTVFVPGASFVTHTQVPGIGDSRLDAVIWASLYSFTGGCQNMTHGSPMPKVISCLGNRQAASWVTVMLYDTASQLLVHHQLLASTGSSHVLAFALPCEDSADEPAQAPNSSSSAAAASCQRHYLAVSNRQLVPFPAVPSPPSLLPRSSLAPPSLLPLCQHLGQLSLGPQLPPRPAPLPALPCLPSPSPTSAHSSPYCHCKSKRARTHTHTLAGGTGGGVTLSPPDQRVPRAV
jgi:hypothetical protein